MEKNLSDFYYVPLEDGSDIKSFEGLAPGKFTEMWGRKVSFSEPDILEIAGRTKAALSMKKIQEGDAFAGLPIEGAGHYSGGAVGWIKDASLSEDSKRVILNPEWNDEGKRILETGERRYFSPTIASLGDESGERIIIGGTLTNWPAIRDENDLPLMKPVALSDGRFTFSPEPENLSQKVLSQLSKLLGMQPGIREEDQFNQEGDTDMGKVNVKETLESMSAEDKAEFITALALEAGGEVEGMLDEHIKTALENVDSQAAVIVGERVEAELVKRETASFAKELVGGGEVGKGLPVDREKLEGFLQSLGGSQLEEARALFSEIQSTGLVDFEEKGSSEKKEQGKKQLSDGLKDVLKLQLERGITVKSFFEANEELGSMDEYDLAEFEKKED